ncbi:MAG: hypothetical protein VZS44_02595 [Bacilli bacterium]|nr:hypothetical protein [Bacilli bacterium]
MNNMNFKLPFYGKKGTIKDIKEDTKYYLVYRYDTSKDKDILFYVPKNEKNLNRLLDNYYNDLKGYLENSSEKYETLKQNRMKKVINTDNIKLMLGISTSLILLSIPLINTHETIGFVGVVLDTLAIPTTSYAISELIKNYKDQKNAKFINNYKKLSQKYQSEAQIKNTNKETIYQGLSKNNNKNHINDLTKTKKLKPENKRKLPK